MERMASDGRRCPGPVVRPLSKTLSRRSGQAPVLARREGIGIRRMPYCKSYLGSGVTRLMMFTRAIVLSAAMPASSLRDGVP